MLVPASRGHITMPTVTPFSDEMAALSIGAVTAPISGSWNGANFANFSPLYLPEPFVVAKAFWCNGATIGSGDAIDIGIYAMTDMSAGRLDLIRSTGPVYSGVAQNVVQEAGWNQVVCRNVMSGNSSVDATSYTTAVVSLSAGKLYILSVENSAASADAVSSVDNGPTFTSRSTTQYNTAANRTSIWTAAPAANYTGTLVINFGANTETGCIWSLEEVSGVDTSTADGVVQQAVATGTSVTPSVTLSAFTTAYNATFAAHGHAAATATTPKAQFQELADATTATPAQALETEWAPLNDTTPNATIVSAAWGSCAIEIKAATAPTSPWRIARANITASFSDSDATSYTTASVTLKRGRCYLMAVENTKASAADGVASITGGGTWTSRSSVAFDTSTAKRISIWSCVPTADYVGTIVIDFSGATQTSCIWSLNEFSGVDTSTSDGIVQQATNTGNTANPNVSLSAFGSTANTTFQCAASVNSGAHTVGIGMTQLSTSASTAPAARMSCEARQDDIRDPGTVVTSSQWGACAVEIKCDTSPLIIPASLPGTPTIYMGFSMSGTTAQIFRAAPTAVNFRAAGIMSSSPTFPLPSSATVVGIAATRLPLAGFSSRSLIG